MKNKMICALLTTVMVLSFDVTIDAKANEAMGEEVVISGADSKVKVAVIPTNEELAICRDTVALVK